MQIATDYAIRCQIAAALRNIYSVAYQVAANRIAGHPAPVWNPPSRDAAGMII
jgi:hypothetical protein